MTQPSSHTPILETDRLILRPLSVDDAKRAYESWTSDPDVARYMSWSTHKSLADTIEWLKAEEQTVDSPTNFTFGFVLKETGELIGSGGILYDEDIDRYGLGYNIMKPYWRQGLGTEATRRILDFAIQEAGIKKLFAYHAVDNLASGAIIQKLGFSYIKDGVFISNDGSKTHPRKEYFLDVD